MFFKTVMQVSLGRRRRNLWISIPITQEASQSVGGEAMPEDSTATGLGQGLLSAVSEALLVILTISQSHVSLSWFLQVLAHLPNREVGWRGDRNTLVEVNMTLNWSNENYSAIICKAYVGTPGLCGGPDYLLSLAVWTGRVGTLPGSRVFGSPDMHSSKRKLMFPDSTVNVHPWSPRSVSKARYDPVTLLFKISSSSPNCSQDKTPNPSPVLQGWHGLALISTPSLLSPCLISLLPGSHLMNPWSGGKDTPNPSELSSNTVCPHLARLRLCFHSPCHWWQLCICTYGHRSPCLHCTPPAGSYIPQAPGHEWEAASGRDSELLPITYPSHSAALLGSTTTTWLCPCSPGVGVTAIAELCIASPSYVGSSVLSTYL